MTAGNVTPDFQRTINVYDSQGGIQPLQVSYVKTGANTWAYEVSYQGDAANISAPNPIATGTMNFNSDGTLANADTSAAPPTGSYRRHHSLGRPPRAWRPQTITFNMGTVGSTNGVTQFYASLDAERLDRRRRAVRQPDRRQVDTRRHRHRAILQRLIAEDLSKSRSRRSPIPTA